MNRFDYERAGAIWLHISSLSSPYGIGTMGRAALDFIDFLSESKIKYWQILPICPIGSGNSPYQSVSSFAGNPLLIDLDLLVEQGLLRKAECETECLDTSEERVRYNSVICSRKKLLRLAFSRRDAAMKQKVKEFSVQNRWLDNFCLFTAISRREGGRPFWLWPNELLKRDENALKRVRGELSEEIMYLEFLQYTFFAQFDAMRAYAKGKGIGLIGDLPIYVAANSADVWENRELFVLGPDAKPKKVAGVPPDAFSAKGQLWGNPIYDWERLKESGYAWWIERLRINLARFDLLRIDHFRAFDSYYAVDADAKDAGNGKWHEGPGKDFFDALKGKLQSLPLIAEDLGELFPSIHTLRDTVSLPGMKVLQFAFYPGFESEHMPHRHRANAVVYTGTHDNDTLRGYVEAQDEATRELIVRYLGCEMGNEVPCLIRSAWASVCFLAVTGMQDLLNLPSEARMNIPGTVSDKNWSWRMKKGTELKPVAEFLKTLAQTYYR